MCISIYKVYYSIFNSENKCYCTIELLHRILVVSVVQG